MKTVAAHNNVSTLDGFALGSRDGIGIEACSAHNSARLSPLDPGIRALAPRVREHGNVIGNIKINERKGV